MLIPPLFFLSYRMPYEILKILFFEKDYDGKEPERKKEVRNVIAR